MDINLLKKAEEAFNFLTDNCPDDIGLKKFIPCNEINDCLDCWRTALEDYHDEQI